MDNFLYQASIYLGATVLAVPIAARLGLGSVLGYLAAGILIGPVLGLVGAETHEIQHFAEFGVVMMLFLIGLELEPHALWDMRNRLLGLGGLQVLLSSLALMGVALAYGETINTALAIGLALSLSSTAIVLQTLTEKRLIQTNGGRNVFSVLLSQDIAVIPILGFLPLLAISARANITPDGSIQINSNIEKAAHAGNFNLVEGLPAWEVALITLAMIGLVIFAGIYLTRPIFRYIHAAHLREMYSALALLIVVGISFLMTLIGISPALGAFLAGVVLASSEFRHELETDLQPFKGLLLGLFFITVGSGIDFSFLVENLAAILAMALLVILIKGGVLWFLGWLFKIQGRDRWLFALGLAQAGEFGFVLVGFSVNQNVMDEYVGQTLLLVIALSMLITPLLFIIYEWIAKETTSEPSQQQHDEINKSAPVIIAGIGRFGQVVNRLVKASGFRTVVLDNNINTIQVMRQFGTKGFLGDPTRPDILRAAGIDTAQVLVVALDDKAAAITLIKIARKMRPDLHIIARAYDRTQTYPMFQAGANDIVREMFDSSLRAGRYVLENIGLSEFEAAEAEKIFYAHDRAGIRELAALWKEDIPVEKNTEYVKRSKELQSDLETALLMQSEKK